MHEELLEILRCPETGERLRLDQPVARDGQIESGWLVSEGGAHRYPIRNSIPRFVPETNYADNFGMQWNKFRQTQLDSFSGHPVSTDRFRAATGWTAAQLDQKWVLDAGCGAGRFAEVAVKTGAKLVALDYSSAVDACRANLGHHPNLHVVQGNIYALPFPKGHFPYVYSLGVLQHTPDVRNAVAALPPMVAPGGSLCIDFYEKSWKSALLPRYWLRPITKRMPQATLFSLLSVWVPRLLPVRHALSRVPVLGHGLKRLVPVADYRGILALSETQHREWSLLDTFDWFAPQFDSPQTPQTLKRWLSEAGLENIEVFRASHLVGRGTAPNAPRH